MATSEIIIVTTSLRNVYNGTIFSRNMQHLIALRYYIITYDMFSTMMCSVDTPPCSQIIISEYSLGSFLSWDTTLQQNM